MNMVYRQNGKSHRGHVIITGHVSDEEQLWQNNCGNHGTYVRRGKTEWKNHGTYGGLTVFSPPALELPNSHAS